jgi:Cu/Ag efflux protein CusF
MIWPVLDRPDDARNRNGSMIRALAGYAYAAGILLALTIAVHAMDVADLERRSIPDDGPVWMAQAQQSETGKMFRGVGVVTAIEPNGSLTINHEPIAGLMPAMEMSFSVNPRALTNGVRPGDRIEFSVEGATYIIRALKVVGHTQ